ncbi:MAG TPA: C39 family peptidase [Candidatus Dormibacteraeota bacterium]
MLVRIEAAFAGIAVLAGLSSAGLAVYSARHAPAAAQPVPSTAVVVSAPPTPTETPSAAPTPTPTPTPLPPSVFIQHVPFTVQAPFANWDRAHEEYCEAAAMLMVGRYYQGQKYPNDRIPPADADAAMGQIVQWERATWPGVLDLSLDKVGQVGQHFYNLQPVVADATLDNVQHALADGQPVIIPVMTHGLPGGQAISPYYSAGNVYHVIVLTGYDGTKMYTNDAGISQGQNYPYQWSALDTAIGAQVGKYNPGKQMLTFKPS